MLDVILEVAYRTDYDTTIKLLTIYSQFNNEDFWKFKYKVLYPNDNYLHFYSQRDNFLIREAGDLIIIKPKGTFTLNYTFGSKLNSTLNDVVKINLQKRYLITDRESYIITQYDNKKDAISYVSNMGNKGILIDMKGIYPCYNKWDVNFGGFKNKDQL